jgi:transposase InsO family protein
MEGRQRRSFTDDYKRQAVDLVASSGRSIGSVAKELGLRDSVLRRAVGSRLAPICSTHRYYAWRARPESQRAAANRELVNDIKRVHRDTNGRYGSPRVHAELRAQGRGASRGRIERLMRHHGIRAIMATPRRVRTTDSRHDFPIAPNLLERNFVAAAPNRIWLADITYVETDQGWLYLATVMDLYSRKIVGWAMADHLRAELPLAALAMAVATQRPGSGLIHHSDRGVQYASAEYRKMMQSAGFRASMSRRADCYDNAPMESFFHTLKTELVHHQHYATREEARLISLLTSKAFTIERGATRPSDISARSRWS